MSCFQSVTIVLGSLCFFGCWPTHASADNGTVVTGSVIGIDPVNQIMRVYVTEVNGQILYGTPDTNFVDYLVSPTTTVLGANSRFVNLANVLVGSNIQLQFVGPLATTIFLAGNQNLNGATDVQSYSPVSYVTHQAHMQKCEPQRIIQSSPMNHQISSLQSIRPNLLLPSVIRTLKLDTAAPFRLFSTSSR